MNSQLLKANERGSADHGWLKANHSFSFSGYFNPDRVHFGMLRVLNDDTVAAGMGFGTHPHENMEIVTIPLEGAIRHRDSMGNEGVIGFGEVQVMSAGSGIHHSEMNASREKPVKLLQVWVFPERENVAPRYGQEEFDLVKNTNKFVTVVTPHDKNDGKALWIYQQAWFSLGIFQIGEKVTYDIRHVGDGVYLFLIDGEISVNGQTLTARDALEITDFDSFDIEMIRESKILLIEVPMQQR